MAALSGRVSVKNAEHGDTNAPTPAPSIRSGEAQRVGTAMYVPSSAASPKPQQLK